MKQILLVKTSLNGEQSSSNKLANELISTIETQTPVNVVTRDVATSPLPHLTQTEMQAWMTAEDERSAEQTEMANLSHFLIEEVQQSDTIVVAMPMYNFGVPSTFKSWLDRIARAGITFRYSENGPVGLLKDKKVIIVATRGGMYQGTEKDSQTQFLKDVFSFIGLTDVHFIYAEGLNMADGQQNLANAQSEIDAFAI
jgi:FMN-dependent NADH-azoreductase